MNINTDGDAKVNVNRFENDNVWNASNRHRVFLPETCGFLSSMWVGVFFSTPFFHPPSIRPSSSSCSASLAYLLLGISLFSQHSCKKNFTLLSFFVAVPIKCVFSVSGENIATKTDSRNSKK